MLFELCRSADYFYFIFEKNSTLVILLPINTNELLNAKMVLNPNL